MAIVQLAIAVALQEGISPDHASTTEQLGAALLERAADFDLAVGSKPGCDFSKSFADELAKALRWPGMQLQRLTTRKPTLEMLEVAITAMNTALEGLPEGEATKEGYTLIPKPAK